MRRRPYNTYLICRGRCGFHVIVALALALGPVLNLSAMEGATLRPRSMQMDRSALSRLETTLKAPGSQGLDETPDDRTYLATLIRKLDVAGRIGEPAPISEPVAARITAQTGLELTLPIRFRIADLGDQLGFPRQVEATAARELIFAFTPPVPAGEPITVYVTRAFYARLIQNELLFAEVMDHEYREEGLQVPHREVAQYARAYVDSDHGISAFQRFFLELLAEEGDVETLQGFVPDLARDPEGRFYAYAQSLTAPTALVVDPPPLVAISAPPLSPALQTVLTELATGGTAADRLAYAAMVTPWVSEPTLQAPPVLISWLVEDPEPDVREASVLALAADRTPATLDALRAQLAQDPYPTVRRALVQALAPDRTPATFDALRAQLAQDNESTVRRALVQALAAQLQARPPAALRAQLAQESSWLMRWALTLALAADRTPATLDVLRKQGYQDPDPYVREASVLALDADRTPDPVETAQSAEVVPIATIQALAAQLQARPPAALRAQLAQEPESYIRRALVQALAPDRTPATFDALRAQLAQEPDLHVRNAITLALAAQLQARPPAALRAALAKARARELDSSESDWKFSWRRRTAILEALAAQLQARPPAALRAQLAQEPESYIRRALVQALAPDRTPATFDALRAQLAQEPESYTRRALVQALAADRDPVTFDALRAQLAQEKESTVRRALVQALRVVAYSLLPAVEDPWVTAWTDSTRYPTSTEVHHNWLAFLHAPSHAQFLDWLAHPAQQQQVEGFTANPAVHLPLPHPERIAQDLPVTSTTARWDGGRTLIVPAATGAGAQRVKLLRPGEPLGHLLVEAALRNIQGPAATPSASVAFGTLTGAPREGAPVFWSPTTPHWVLRYPVADEPAFASPPGEWRAQNFSSLAPPHGLSTLQAWLQRAAQELAQLAHVGWGYIGLLEYYHDGANRSRYDLNQTDLGELGHFSSAFTHANLRAQGQVVDRSPEHMVPFGPDGPTAAQLAQVLRDQIFQLALTAVEVALREGVASDDNPTAIAVLLQGLGNDMASAYRVPARAWEAQLPVSVQGIAAEAVFAFTHRQGPTQTDLGFDHGAFSSPGLLAFAETLARGIVTARMTSGSSETGPGDSGASLGDRSVRPATPESASGSLASPLEGGEGAASVSLWMAEAVRSTRAVQTHP